MSSSRTFRAFAGTGQRAGRGAHWGTIMGTTIGLCAALLWPGCADYLTGQLEEPKGPIQVTKLTLFDASSRDAPVFTDTSLPDCKMAPDCTKPENRESCASATSVTTTSLRTAMHCTRVRRPGLGADIRVVFNKAALQFDSKELGTDFDPAKEASASDSSKAARCRKDHLHRVRRPPTVCAQLVHQRLGRLV